MYAIYFAPLHTSYYLPLEGMCANQPTIIAVGTLTWILSARASVYIFLIGESDS